MVASALRIACMLLAATCTAASWTTTVPGSDNNPGLRVQFLATQNPQVKTIAGRPDDAEMGVSPSSEGIYTYYGTDFFASALGGPGMDDEHKGGALGALVHDSENTGKARFRKPVDISGDCTSSVSCDLYVTDSDDHRLRKLFMDDRELYIADTVAGTGIPGFQDSADGEVQFNTPSGVVVAQNASVAYVADRGNHRIRKVQLQDGFTETLAGFSGAVGQYVRLVKPNDGNRIEIMEIEVFGPGGTRLWPTASSMSGTRRFDSITRIWHSDASYCHDGNRATHCRTEDWQQLEHWVELDFGAQVAIGKIIVVTQATPRDNFGPGNQGVAQFLVGAELRVSPAAASMNSNLYYSGNVQWSETITTAAETHEFAPYINGGHHDADGTEAQFNKPTGLAISPDQRTLWVSEQGVIAHVIRKVDLGGAHTVETFAGDTPGNHNAIGLLARFNEPAGLVVDPEEPNYLYVADSANHQIRRVDLTTQEVSTYAGEQSHGWDYLDAVGTEAKFQTPWGMAIHAIHKCDGTVDRQLFVTDRSDHRVRTVNMETLQVSTLAGDIFPGHLDGGPFSSRFNTPTGIQVSFAGGGGRAVYIADSGNMAIKQIEAFIKVPTCADPLSHASITVSSVVPVGAEIHVKLSIAAGHSGQVLGTADGDWVGLFRAGECGDSGETDQYSVSGLHKCHLAWRQISVPRLTELSFVFGAHEYAQEPGEYEVRYFTSNSGPDTQKSGIVCGADYGVQGRLSLDGFNTLCWYDVYATSPRVLVGKNTYSTTAQPDRSPFNGIGRADLQKIVPGLEYDSLAL